MTTIVAVFTEGRQARQAVLDLVTSGVPHEDISILTADTHGASAHDHLGEIVESLGAPSTLTISEIGPLIAAGAFAAALVGTSAGAGDLLDLLLSNGVSAEQAHGNIEGLRLGGTLIAVQSDDVRDILVLGVFTTMLIPR